MKKRVTILVLWFSFFSAAAQQLPNGGFDTWTNPLFPDGWSDIESIYGVPYNFFSFRDAIDKVQGAASIKLISDTVPGRPAAGIVGGFVVLGTATPGGPEGFTTTGLAFTYHPDTIFFSYKYTSPGIDTAALSLEFRRLSTGPADQGDTLDLFDARISIFLDSNWHEMAVPLDSFYKNNRVDTIRILFTSSGGHQPVMGSTLHVDGVRFGYCAAIATSLTADSSLICLHSNPVNLHGSPTGGVFSGTGVNGSQFNPDSAGTAALSYSYTSAAGCKYHAYDTLTVQVCTGLHETEANVVFKVYPNPASQFLHIESAVNISGYCLLIFDVAGSLTARYELEGAGVAVGISHLATGTYFYKLLSKDGGLIERNKLTVIN